MQQERSNYILAGWIVVIEGENKGRAFKLKEGKNIIGSSPGCDVFLPEEGVEPYHASVRCSGGKAILTDLDTDSGTYIGDKRVFREELKDETLIRIGKVLLAIKLL